MLDIVFLSRIIPQNMKEVSVKRKNTMTESGEALAWNIIKGLDENLEQPITLFNYLPVQSYPKYYTDIYIKRSVFSHADGSHDINLSFLNIPYIKRVLMGNSLYKEIKKWANNSQKGKKILISYSMSPESTTAMEIAKKINPKIVTCAIVADLPEYTILTNKIDVMTRIYLNWIKNKTNKRLKYIDKFVLLTKYMAEKLVTSQKYIVMEGIATQCAVKKKLHDNYIVVYAGTLNERFGILHLISAFKKTKDKRLRLVLCGKGDAEALIQEEVKTDSRIVFKGQLSRNEVLNIIAQSDVIVNPRQGIEEFTKYSFPSKNMEALSSGVPLIAYKLLGIPDEYDSYINYPKENDDKSLAKLIECVAIDKEGLYLKKAIEAKLWIEKNKNAKNQAERILKLVNTDIA